MNILLVNTLYPPNVRGGAELSVEALAAGLAGRNHRVTILTIAQNWGKGVGDAEAPPGVSVHFRTFSPWASRIGELSVLETAMLHVSDLFRLAGGAAHRALEQQRFDIVHTNNLVGITSRIWRDAARAGIPIVHTLRDYYLLCLRGTMHRGGKSCADQCASCRVVSRLRTRGMDRVGAVVGISRFILDVHKRAGVIAPKTVQAVIANASNAPRHAVPPPKRSGSDTVFGYLGRLHYSKGLETLIRAFSALKGPARLRIAGSGDPQYAAHLKGLAQDPRIEFVGFVVPGEFLPSIDVLVLPSEWPEPLGRVVFEAYDYGIPTIASAHGGIPEIIDKDVTGWLFTPGDAAELANLMGRVMDSRAPGTEMRSACLKKAVQFTPDRCASEYETVYSGLLEQDRLLGSARLVNRM